MHDQHFLERLERLDDDQGQEALALYYDAPLVRALIGYAKLDSDSDRVAISLDDPHEGPFVLVARDGGFVTALGRGMSPAPHPVIPRAALDAIRREHVHVKEAWAAAVRVSRGRSDQVMHGFLRDGGRVSREVMSGLIATASAREWFWVRLCLDLARVLYLALAEAMEGDAGAWRARREAYFRDITRAVHALANTLVILGASDFKRRPDSDPLVQVFRRHRPTAALALYGFGAAHLRAVWAVGKFGGAFLSEYKAMLRGPEDIDALDAALVLSAIGTRFARHRGEVRKALSVRHGPFADDVRGAFALHTLSHDLDRARAREALRDLGERTVRAKFSALPADHPLRGSLAGPLPDALTLPAALGTVRNIFVDPRPETAAYMAYVGGGISGLEAEELYYPHAVAERLDLAEGVADVRETMNLARRAWRPAPVQVMRGPGRNERCACGSGKKSKRCCAAPMLAVA